MSDKFVLRFKQLQESADALIASATREYSPYSQVTESYIDDPLMREWKLKAGNLIQLVCGERSLHVKEFNRAGIIHGGETNIHAFTRLRAVLRATQDDYENGFLESLRSLIQAEVFGSELEQAAELLRQGYDLPAAVIARTVLEQGLLQLCARVSPPIAKQKLDKMNADLAKAGLYNNLEQKRVTWLAGIGNAAAHGEREKFTRQEVERMIPDVEAFLAKYL